MAGSAPIGWRFGPPFGGYVTAFSGSSRRSPTWVKVDYDALRVLDSLPGLATRVHEDILLRPLLAQSAPLINAPAAWNARWDVVVS